ncbi:glycolate oxidase subunit GlcE [Rhodobacteraceae bacterium NNCM2]|nr:glycolate oxidase subunit GlcE [Coraliihabitans acroporae]
MTEYAPTTEGELAEIVADAAKRAAPLEITGGGTRLGLGRPVQAEAKLSTSAISGISLYEPAALTLVVKAGTPVAEVEAALAGEGQMLPFEPMDHRSLLGSTGEPTIGGVVACAVSGPRRIQAGACRDAMIGVRFVDGRGEVIRNGGRVMKNVTGYDLVKLMAGQYGTLGVLTEIAFKVLPRPARSITVTIDGLEDAKAVNAMAEAMGSPFDVSGAAHANGKTLLRVHGMADQAGYRAEQLARRLRAFGTVEQFEGEASDTLWQGVRDCAGFAGTEGAVWRLSVKPSDAPGMVAAIHKALPAEVLYDWAGGLVWLKVPEEGDAGDAAIRAQTGARGGHATLVRASATTRAAVEVFEPEAAPLARISAGLRAKFDPSGILNPGRMRA